MRLKELEFADLYLGARDSWLSGVPNTMDPIAAPKECVDELSALRDWCKREFERTNKFEFRFAFSDIAYRFSLLRTVTEDVYVLRRFPDAVPDLRTLGIHSHYVELLLSPRLSGLIVVAGAVGQGKTTTASAIVAGRIAKYGGIAVCIEDPPEMPLEGRCGEGVIYQRWAEQGTFAYECRQAARFAPSIIYLGEVRDAETATEALRASVNGQLIVCTIHSDNARTAVDRFYSLANGSAGSPDDVSSLLAAGLLGIFHQRLEGEPRRPKIESLWLGGKDALGVRSTIRQRKFQNLDSEIAMQRQAILMQATRG